MKQRSAPLRLSLLAVLLAQLACNRLFPPKPAVAWDTSATAQIIRATNCCGLVPRNYVDNYIPEAQVWGDGRILWVEYGAGGARRVLQGQLSTAEMTQLLDDVVQAGFFGWQDSYADYSVTDMPSTCLSVSLLSDSKSVCEYARGAPRAFHQLRDRLGSGAGAAATEFVPSRAYLTAYAQTSGPSGTPVQWHWPADSLGFSLYDAQGGRYVDGPALDLAWRVVNAQPWGGTVQDGDSYYQLTVIVPDVSMSTPPNAP